MFSGLASNPGFTFSFMSLLCPILVISGVLRTEALRLFWAQFAWVYWEFIEAGTNAVSVRFSKIHK